MSCILNFPLSEKKFKLGIYECDAEDNVGNRFNTFNIAFIFVEFIFFNE